MMNCMSHWYFLEWFVPVCIEHDQWGILGICEHVLNCVTRQMHLVSFFFSFLFGLSEITTTHHNAFSVVLVVWVFLCFLGEITDGLIWITRVYGISGSNCYAQTIYWPLVQFHFMWCYFWLLWWIISDRTEFGFFALLCAISQKL